MFNTRNLDRWLDTYKSKNCKLNISLYYGVLEYLGPLFLCWKFMSLSICWCRRDGMAHAEVWLPLSALANWLAVLLLTTQLICLVDSCSRWANWWLIITAYRRIGLLRKRKLTCGGKTGFCGPSESFYVFPATSGCKRGSTNNPSECAGSPSTVVYDGCNG